MAQLFSTDTPTLQNCWGKVNPTDAEYVAQSVLIEWTQAVLLETKVLSRFDQATTDIKGMIAEYLIEIHQLELNTVSNVQFTFAEAVDFFNWCTASMVKPNQSERPEEQPVEAPASLEPLSRSHLSKASKNSQSMFNLQVQPDRAPEQEESKKEKASKSQGKQEKKVSEERVMTEQPDEQQGEEEGDEKNERAKNGDVAERSREHLRMIFEHYCKITYASGQDPTFDQIMHKTTIMTINKFMIFCKDFELASASPLITRVYLLEIFKKNSLCYKQMSASMFLEALTKIAYHIFSEIADQNRTDFTASELSPPLLKLVQFLEISTMKNFKEKMKKLNITNKPVKLVAQKKAPLNYRFKFTSSGGKAQDQIIEELQERKANRSERKIMLLEKVGVPKVSQPKCKPLVSQYRKNETNLSLNEPTPKRQVALSVQSQPKFLPPPMPPARKISYKRTEHSEASNAPSLFKNTNQGDLGYADLHRLKISEGYSRKPMALSKQASNYKLNSIVEQAKQFVKDMPMSNRVSQSEPYSEDVSDTEALESRDRQKRVLNMEHVSRKMQQISDKTSKDRENQEQLAHLLNMEQDEDEFLKEHLERESRQDAQGNKILHRINELHDH